MSSPARQVRVRPAAKPRTRTSPSPKQPPKRRVSEKREGRGSAAFYVFATLLLAAMVFGLAALNAVLAQGAFHVEELSKQQVELTQQSGELRRQIDDLSSPARLTSEATKDGLVFPDTDGIQVVHAGAADSRDASPGHKKDSKTPGTDPLAT